MDQNTWERSLSEISSHESTSEFTSDEHASDDYAPTILQTIRERLSNCRTESDSLRSTIDDQRHNVLFVGKNGNGKSTLIKRLIHECFIEASRQEPASQLDSSQSNLQTDDRWLRAERSGSCWVLSEYQDCWAVFGAQPGRMPRNVPDLKVGAEFKKNADGNRHLKHKPDHFPLLPCGAGSSTTAAVCHIKYGDEFEVVIVYKSANLVALVIKHFRMLMHDLDLWLREKERRQQAEEDSDDYEFEIRPEVIP